MNSIKHILSLISFTYIINLIRIFIQEDFSILGVTNRIIDALYPIKNLVLFLGFNVTTISGVAWFLFALLYCYIFNYIFYKFASNQIVIYICILFGFLGGLTVRFIFPILGISFSSINNIWFCGMPYFCLGKIFSLAKNKVKKVSLKILVAFFVLGVIFVAIGFVWVWGFLYLGNLLSAVSLFLISIKNERPQKYKNSILDFISKMGNQYAFLIYIIHPIIIHIFAFLLEYNLLLFKWFYPIIILLITIFISVIYILCKSKLKIRNNT